MSAATLDFDARIAATQTEIDEWEAILAQQPGLYPVNDVADKVIELNAEKDRLTAYRKTILERVRSNPDGDSTIVWFAATKEGEMVELHGDLSVATQVGVHVPGTGAGLHDWATLDGRTTSFLPLETSTTRVRTEFG